MEVILQKNRQIGRKVTPGGFCGQPYFKCDNRAPASRQGIVHCYWVVKIIVSIFFIVTGREESSFGFKSLAGTRKILSNF